MGVGVLFACLASLQCSVGRKMPCLGFSVKVRQVTLRLWSMSSSACSSRKLRLVTVGLPIRLYV